MMSSERKKHPEAPVQRFEGSENTGNAKAAPDMDLQASKGMEMAYWPSEDQGTYPARQVARYMADEMNRNAASDKAAEIKRKFWSLNPIENIESLIDWKEMVDYNAPWDHKPKIAPVWGDYQLDPPFNNTEWYHDIWSNIHYGYVGKACGIYEWMLLDGAGIAQLLSSNVPGGLPGYLSRRLEKIGDFDVFRALDDSSDQLATRLGFDLWGREVTEVDVLQIMRNNKDGLNHR